MFIFSETPTTEMWNYLNFLSIENNCKRLLNGEIKSNRTIIYKDGDILNRKAKEVSMCLKQAHEFIVAFEAVSINTSPLLLFYSMLSLSKALIVANKESLFLNDIKYHGLESKIKQSEKYSDFQTYSENPSSWNLEKEYAVTNNGVFQHLIEILDDSAFPLKSVIEFKDIMKCIPTISEFYKRYYNEQSSVLQLYSIDEKFTPKYDLTLSITAKKPEDILEIIPELINDFDFSNELLHGQAITFKSKNLESFPNYMAIRTPMPSGRYVIKGIRYFDGDAYKEKVLSIESLDYIAIYILSICVRYKQVLWGQVISGEESGVIGLVNIYINSIKRRYSNKILNKLFEEEYIYASGGLS